MADVIRVAAERLDESQLRHLRDTYAGLSVSGDLPDWQRRWYADLAHALNAKLGDRVMEWASVLDDPAVPPSWDVAVAALGEVS
jgi:hypothetical protein